MRHVEANVRWDSKRNKKSHDRTDRDDQITKPILERHLSCPLTALLPVDDRGSRLFYSANRGPVRGHKLGQKRAEPGSAPAGGADPA